MNAFVKTFEPCCIKENTSIAQNALRLKGKGVNYRNFPYMRSFIGKFGIYLSRI